MLKCNRTFNIRIQVSGCRVKLHGIRKVQQQANPEVGPTPEMDATRPLSAKRKPRTIETCGALKILLVRSAQIFRWMEVKQTSNQPNIRS